eukprot:TRINITY_DN10483_c0_g3_i2.p1 TRINITY_DN10483_c0_g3~~TRINITY_DN10483_c0_g3_i2.p1  ORF type:complete len:297 (+),score=51.26 TRINITY_DN10483_c0_g3_i2:95-892(+)
MLLESERTASFGPGEDRSSKQARGKVRANEPQPSWTLFWCNERCYKAEMVEMKKKLHQAASVAGAAFLCGKKADKYRAWLTTRCPSSHVLVTDWREVKPSLCATDELALIHRPMSVIVLCDNNVSLRRASDWASSFNDVSITVLPESGSGTLWTLIASFGVKMGQAHSDEANKSSGGSYIVQQERATLMSPSERFLPPTIVEPPCMQSLTDPAEETEDAVETSSFVSQPKSFMLLNVLLEAVSNRHFAAKIHDILLQNMPDVYED